MPKNELDGRQCLANAGVIEDFGTILGEGHVEIHADQHVLVLELIGSLGEAANGWDVHVWKLSFLRDRESPQLQSRCAMTG